MMYFLLAFWALGAAFMTWKASRLWKDAALIDHFIDAFAFLPFGPAVRRGEIRALGLMAVSLWAIAVLILLGVTDTDLTGVWLGVFAAALLAILVCLLLEVMVVLFNRPAFVVPPHMRSDPGVLTRRGARGPSGR